MTDTIDEPVAPGESPGSQPADDAAAGGSALAPDQLVVLAPDILAQSLGDYLRA